MISQSIYPFLPLACIRIKGIVHKFCYHLLTLKLFQTCMNFFLLLNSLEDILKNVGNQRFDALCL